MDKTVWFIFAFLSAIAVKIEVAAERRNLANPNPGFISIDCGVDKDYLEETTGLYYKSDVEFVSTGQNADISGQFDYGNTSLSRLVQNLRFFSEGRKNCYTLKPEQGKNNNYIINAYFKYGNYDDKNEVPIFNVYIGGRFWTTVEPSSSDSFHHYTLVYFSRSDFIYICLVNTGSGIPFISGLELRPLNNSIYRTDSGLAGFYGTYDVGNLTRILARYKDDAYDRMWYPYMPKEWVRVNSSENLEIQNKDDSYRLPFEVLRSATQPQDNLTSLSFSTNYTFGLNYFNVYFHFLETQKIPQGLKREFNITLSGVQYGPFTPQYLKPMTIVCEKAQLLEGFIQFSINSTLQSDLPPILNSFEILVDFGSENDPATNPVDVNAILGIKQLYNIHRPDWQGDPCVPRDYLWSGLNCTTYNDTPRITSIYLGSSALSGEIASEFSNLQALQYLDLSNNELIGKVPEFLGELRNLVALNLSGNRLTGPLPPSLIEKSSSGKLKLSFDEKPKPDAEKKKPKTLTSLLISFISSSALLNLVLLAIFWRVKIHGVAGDRSGSLLKSNKQYFTYSDIVNMTDNFTNIIGEGGFGKVYFGESNDGTLVAVKLLSESSKQGLNEYLSEVQLLMMVHHRNLVSLIGFCDDNGKMALVYEFMENGNLKDHLSEESSFVLNWRERLQIAVDAAQGLEYLHNGCKPSIVHRDLKTSNILLNENFLAKISDFGLSRVYATDIDTHVSTNPAGTFGYVDPEFYATGNLSKKSDVYSFGIILFELITGQPATIRGEEYTTHIVQWVTPIIERGDIHGIVDSRLEGEFNTNCAWKVVEIAMSSISRTAIQRPDISEVLAELKECVAMEMAGEGSERMRSVSDMTRSSKTLEMSSSFNDDTQLHPKVR